ncbi:MAG: alpha/beta hydrolase [Cyanobacteria bacterium P01_A01_bin.105]
MTLFPDAFPDALWLTASPALKKFDQRLLCQLNRYTAIQRWEYHQTADEPCCLETPVTLLHDYLKSCSAPVHLLGHGLSGIVGLMYARRFPQRVKSLTLLSVNATPALNWQAHYYALRQLLPCSRDIVLAQMVKLLFGPQGYDLTKVLVEVLKQDLDTGLSLHSLMSRSNVPSGPIDPPLLVCYGSYDNVLAQPLHERWQPYLKSTDRLWQCVGGRHFFHFDQPKALTQAIRHHWQQQDHGTVTVPVSVPAHVLTEET